MPVIYHYQAYHYKETCWNFSQNTSCIQENAYAASKILITLFRLECVQLEIKTLSRVRVFANEQLVTVVWKWHMLVNFIVAQKIHNCVKYITKTIITFRIHFYKNLHFYIYIHRCPCGITCAQWYTDAFCITGPLWGESTGHQWISLTNHQKYIIFNVMFNWYWRWSCWTVKLLVIWDTIFSSDDIIMFQLHYFSDLLLPHCGINSQV